MKQSFLFLGLFAFFSTLAHADEVQGDILDQENYDHNVPYFQKIKPSWGAGLRFALPAFPIKTAIGGIYEIYAEKMLGFQYAGILSLGLHFAFVPLSGSRFDNIKFGGALRYQLRLVRNQPLVPTIALVYDQFRLKKLDNTVYSFSSPSILFGALLNLGFFDSETARDGHESIGIVRSYLSLEFRPKLSFNYDGVLFSGSVWYMGIRLEFE